jgi:predicted PurR-regulated permease PerM
MLTTRWQATFLLLLLLGSAVLAFFIFRPYLGALVVAATFAVVFHPVYLGMLARLKGRANLAAALTTLCVLVVVILPLAWFGFQLFGEARELYLKVTDPATDLSGALQTATEDNLAAFISPAQLNIGQYTEQTLQWLVQHTGQLFASVAKIGVNIFISLFALFYLLRDGQKIRARLIVLSPLADTHDRRIVDRLHLAVNSVIKGSLLIALVQGILTGLGLALFGVPSPVLWGSIAIIAALIPAVGTAAVVVPAVMYLFLANQLAHSIGLLLWGTLIVGLVDNLLRPSLIGRGINIHPLLILLSVIGGLSFFGPLGFILGPLVVSLLFALLDVYEVVIAKPTGRPRRS